MLSGISPMISARKVPPKNPIRIHPQIFPCIAPGTFSGIFPGIDARVVPEILSRTTPELISRFLHGYR